MAEYPRAASENVCESPLATRPLLYTDTIRGAQTMRDDLWAVTTAELNRLCWQPIATAPKDGRWMLLGSFVSCFMGHWDHQWKDQRGALRDPTHWMPLPEPPRV